MNIPTKEGDKVIVSISSIKNGYQHDIDCVEKHLIIYKIYTVDYYYI